MFTQRILRLVIESQQHGSQGQQKRITAMSLDFLALTLFSLSFLSVNAGTTG